MCTTDPALWECMGYIVASPDQRTYFYQFSALVKGSGFDVEPVDLDESDREWPSIEALEAFFRVNSYVYVWVGVCFIIITALHVSSEEGGARENVEMRRRFTFMLLYFIMALLPQVSSDGVVGKPTCSS
jgi:hypothetical protein